MAHNNYAHFIKFILLQFDRYADQQSQLKLEGVEIGDKEADESPVESEDEEINDDSNSLDDKGKRKDRLRRLLEEKSRKSLEDNQEPERLPQKKDIFEDVQSVTDDDIVITKIEGINTSVDRVRTSSNQKAKESSVENKITDDKVEDQIDKDNCIAKITSDADSDNDIEEVDEKTTVVKTGTKLDQDDRINLISDESDGEELNLLQELHSGDDVSSPDSSDVDDSPISEKLKSNYENYDVISIENSSYSESESVKDDVLSDEIEIKGLKSDEQHVYNLDDDSQTNDRQEPALERELDDQENYVDAYEHCLLASSEDEDTTSKEVALDKYSGNYINLKDDEISISETQLQEVRNFTTSGKLSQTVSSFCNGNSDFEIDIHKEHGTVVLSNDVDGIVGAVAEKNGCNKSVSIEVAVGDKVVEKQLDNQKLQAPIIATVTLCDDIFEDDNSLKALEPS